VRLVTEPLKGHAPRVIGREDGLKGCSHGRMLRAPEDNGRRYESRQGRPVTRRTVYFAIQMEDAPDRPGRPHADERARG